MDLTLPITTGSLALIIGGCIGKEAIRIIRSKVAAWDMHVAECGKKALTDAQAETVKAVDYARLESKVEGIDTKVCELKDSMTERTNRINKMDDKLDTIIMRLER